MAVSDKIMFEIYREEGYARNYRVVYFTELDEHNKEVEIARAMAGQHLFDGFIAETTAAGAKQAISDLLTRLNDGEPLDENAVGRLLEPHMAD